MRRSDAGEGKLGTILSLVLLAAGFYAAWNVIPVYYANYSFADRVVELARAPKYNHPDDQIMRLLVRAAEERKLEDYIHARTCKITTMDYRRKILCEYDREVQVLPGWKHTFHFVNEADQPLL